MNIKFKVTREFIQDLLKMPPFSRIEDVRYDSDYGRIEFVVQDDTLPNPKAGEPIPETTPTINVVTWDWNIS